MQQAGSANSPSRRRWLVRGAIGSVLLSLLVSGAYAAIGRDPSAMVGVLPTEGILGIWGIASVAMILSLVVVWTPAQAVVAQRRRAPALGMLATCLLSALVLGPAAWATSEVVAGAPTADQARQTLVAVIPACNGRTPLAGAAPYAGTRHPLEVVEASAGGGMTGRQSDISARAATLDPMPATLDSVQLVICIQEGTTTEIETCSYSAGGKYTRYRHSRDVVVYAALTGEMLGRKAVDGSAPSACPDVKAPGYEETYGDDVGWDDAGIWDYVATWVSGPPQSPAPTERPTVTPTASPTDQPGSQGGRAPGPAGATTIDA